METIIIQPYNEPKGWSDQHTQSFDKEKITVTKCGKTYNQYDYIQAQREDTEIYATLEKYGNIEKLERPAREVYADLTNALDLRGLFDQDKRLQELFYSLPLEERQQFNHDFYTFKENGLNFYLEKAKKESEKNKTNNENEEKITTKTTEVKNNE